MFSTSEGLFEWSLFTWSIRATYFLASPRRITTSSNFIIVIRRLSHSHTLRRMDSSRLARNAPSYLVAGSSRNHIVGTLIYNSRHNTKGFGHFAISWRPVTLCRGDIGAVCAKPQLPTPSILSTTSSRPAMLTKLQRL